MRSNYAAMCKRLEKRGVPAVVGTNGKIWSDELETYLTVEEATASGHGKARRTKKEKKEFDELLLSLANRRSGRLIRSVRAKGQGVDREALLNELISLDERIAVGHRMATQCGEERRKLQNKLDDAKAGNYIPRCEWDAIVKAQKDWQTRKEYLWSCFWELKDYKDELVQKHNLWPDWYKNIEYSPSIWNAGENRECKDMEMFTRTMKENDTFFILGNTHIKENNCFNSNKR